MNDYIIRISEDALIQICLNGLEAYSVSHKGVRKQKNRLETYGLLWGYEVLLPGAKKLYNVEFVSIDTSAKQDHSSVDPNDQSLELKRELITSFWPHYDFLGDVHTHPYEHYTDVLPIKGYNYSSTDINRIENNTAYWSIYNYRVGLVLTVSRLHRKPRRGLQHLDTSTIEFTLGKYRLWLKGYVATLENDELKISTGAAQRVSLDCPALLGLGREYTGFNELEESCGAKNKADNQWSYIFDAIRG